VGKLSIDLAQVAFCAFIADGIEIWQVRVILYKHA